MKQDRRMDQTAPGTEARIVVLVSRQCSAVDAHAHPVQSSKQQEEAEGRPAVWLTTLRAIEGANVLFANNHTMPVDESAVLCGSTRQTRMSA